MPITPLHHYEMSILTWREVIMSKTYVLHGMRNRKTSGQTGGVVQLMLSFNTKQNYAVM